MRMHTNTSVLCTCVEIHQSWAFMTIMHLSQANKSSIIWHVGGWTVTLERAASHTQAPRGDGWDHGMLEELQPQIWLPPRSIWMKINCWVGIFSLSNMSWGKFKDSLCYYEAAKGYKVICEFVSRIFFSHSEVFPFQRSLWTCVRYCRGWFCNLSVHGTEQCTLWLGISIQ